MRLRLTLPTIEEIGAGLDVNAAYPPLAKAEKAAADAQQQLQDARERFAAATSAAESLPAKVRTGEATPLDLEAALVAQRSAALIVPEYEVAVDEALQRVAVRRTAAREALSEVAGRRHAQLQREADKLAPALEALRALERELLDGARCTDENGCIVFPNIPRLRWPLTITDESRGAADRHARDLAASGLPQSEYAQRYGRR